MHSEELIRWGKFGSRMCIVYGGRFPAFVLGAGVYVYGQGVEGAFI